MIAIKLDVKKLNKGFFFQGKTALYADLVLKDNKDGPDQYGNDGFVVQNPSKEAREAGERGPIVGNWKHVGGAKPQAKPAPKAAPKPEPDVNLDAEPDQIPW